MASEDTRTRQEVTVTDVRMPFGSMVVFMVKWAVAAIPALAILVTAAGIIASVLGVAAGLLGGIADTLRSDSDGSAENPAALPSPSESTSHSAKHDPARAAGTGNIYMNAADKSIHFPGCEAVSGSSSVGTWAEALAKEYSSHQCRVSGR